MCIKQSCCPCRCRREKPASPAPSRPPTPDPAPPKRNRGISKLSLCCPESLAASLRRGDESGWHRCFRHGSLKQPQRAVRGRARERPAPGSLRGEGGAGGGSAGTEPGRPCRGLSAAVTSLQASFAGPAEAGVSFLTQLLVPFHCSADSSPSAPRCCVQQPPAPRLEARPGSSGSCRLSSVSGRGSCGTVGGPPRLPHRRPGQESLGTTLLRLSKDSRASSGQTAGHVGGSALPALRSCPSGDPLSLLVPGVAGCRLLQCRLSPSLHIFSC